MAASFVDTDKGFKNLQRVMNELQGAIKVGVDDRPHPSGMATDELAKIHEFGLGRTPERSFLRGWIDTHRENVKLSYIYWARKAIKGEITGPEVYGKVAEFCVRSIRANIKVMIPPPLLPATVARKTGGHPEIPLIDSGTLMQAIVWEFRKAS